MKELRLYVVFKDSAKLGSINSLLSVADTESNGTSKVLFFKIDQNELVLTGFDDPAIRRRVLHEINSRYHNMIQSISEFDYRTRTDNRTITYREHLQTVCNTILYQQNILCHAIGETR